MSDAVESGVKALRTFFIRETTVGTTPANPDWLRVSESIQSADVGIEGNIFSQRSVGSHLVQKFQLGPEDNTFELSYHLQRWFRTGAGAAQDPGYDGLVRTADGSVPSTHSFFMVQDLASGGALGGGQRIYTIVKGGRIGQVTLAGDPNTGEPCLVTLQYVAEKVRSYRIAQPTTGSTVDVVSTSTADTTQDVLVENRNAGTTETISLNGTTPVSGLTSFTDIDTISLSAETVGDVVIEISGTEICRILGQTSNGGFVGDLGIPPLGTGSYEAALTADYARIVGSTLTRGGVALETDATIRSFEMQANNNLDIHPRLDSRSRRIVEGNADYQAVVSIFSPAGSHDSLVEHLKATESDLVWTLTKGSLTLTNSVLMTQGGRPYQVGQAVLERNNTFAGYGLTVSNET